MTRKAALAAIVLAACSPGAVEEDREDAYLRRVIAAYDLRPLSTKPFEETAKFRLGQALFFDPILSGNRDVSCATCHLPAFGLSDGLAASIGTGGEGLGDKRVADDSRPAQPRNALDLWNRDNNAVRTMFWDGRIEALASRAQRFRTPLGNRLPEGFENLMAAQAIFPMTQEDEMLGLSSDRSPHSLPTPHAGRPNELAAGAAGLEGRAAIEAALDLIVERLTGGGEPSEPWHGEYRRLFRNAYPDVPGDGISIVHVGNALAHFEEIAFATRDTAWDRYLAGEKGAIGTEAKRGALLFFGRAGCAVCHNGPLLSDFEFHSVGAPTFGPGYDGQGEDTGRFRVTGDADDMYKFRTPPLRNITLTAPYFHNGSATSLEEAIHQHLDPLRFADRYTESGGAMMTLNEIAAVSPALTIRHGIGEEEIAALMSFLTALEDRATAASDRILPASVPSGLPLPN